MTKSVFSEALPLSDFLWHLNYKTYSAALPLQFSSSGTFSGHKHILKKFKRKPIKFFIESAQWADSIQQSRYPCIYLYIYLSVPFPCEFFRGLSLALRSHDQIPASHWSTLLAWNKTRFWLLRVIRPSISHGSILLHAWSLKDGGWMQSWEGIFFAWYKTGFWLLCVIRQAPLATRPSYYTHGALKTRGGCRAGRNFFLRLGIRQGSGYCV